MFFLFFFFFFLIFFFFVINRVKKKPGYELEIKSSSIYERYKNEKMCNSEMPGRFFDKFHVLVKCNNKFDCLIECRSLFARFNH